MELACMYTLLSLILKIIVEENEDMGYDKNYCNDIVITITYKLWDNVG